MKRDTKEMTNRIDELVGRLREGIRKAEREGRRPPRSPERASRLPPLHGAEDLRDLNREWMLEPAVPIRSHRKVVGPAIVAVKRRLQRLVVAVLEGYFTRERTFFSNVVRYLNRMTDHVERLDREQQRLERVVEELRSEVDRLRSEREREDGH